MTTTETDETTPAPSAADARRARTDEKASAAVAAIVAAIETGAANPADWRAPWHTDPRYLSPMNETTGNPYTGGNRWLLMFAAMDAGYERNAWATFNQWKAAGAMVRKGQRGSIILRPRTVKATDDAGNERVRVVGYSAHYVFNVAQVDGYTIEPLPEAPAPATDWHDDADDYMTALATVIRTEHSHEPRAYYSPTADRVHLPEPILFASALDYYSTRAHEYAHATGHENRLARTFGKRFGDDAYAAEELTAELTAALVMAQLGLSSQPRPDHAQYLAHWLRVLKADPSHLFHVAGKAEKAAAWLAETATPERIADARRLRETFAPVAGNRPLALI